MRAPGVEVLLPLAGHLRALLPRLREADRDGLLATLDRLTAAPALQRPLLPLAHRALDFRALHLWRDGADDALAHGVKSDVRFAQRSAQAHEWLGEIPEAIEAHKLLLERQPRDDARRSSLQALVRLLDYMARHPRRDVFTRGLPRSGQPGSLLRRFVGTPLEGGVVAKTGSIYHSNSLSGYIERPGGRRITFALMVNSHTASSREVLARIDSVVVEIGKGR